MSPFTREHYIDEIINALSYLKSRVKLDNTITKYTINIEAETFYAGFLNVVYGFRLKNANHSKKNFPSIDLYEESKGDDGQRVAVQVTSDNSSNKIKKTLKSFCQNGYQKDYTRLIILIITDKKPYGSVFAFPEGTGIQFDQSRDILDVSDLIKDIGQIDDTDHLRRIYEFLKKELLVKWKRRAATISALVVAAAFVAIIYFCSTTYPLTPSQYNLVSSLISHMMSNMQQVDLARSSYVEEMDRVITFVEGKTTDSETKFKDELHTYGNKIKKSEDSITSLSDQLRSQLIESNKFDVDDLDDFLLVLVNTIDEYVDSIDFIRDNFIGNEEIRTEHMKEYLRLLKEKAQLDAEMLYYQLNDILLPVINEKVLNEQKKKFPQMTFTCNKDVLLVKEEQIYKQYKELLAKYAELFDKEEVYIYDTLLWDQMKQIIKILKVRGEDTSEIENRFQSIHEKQQKLEKTRASMDSRKRFYYSRGRKIYSFLEGRSLSVTIRQKELTDTWKQVIDASKDGSYKNKYMIGSTKVLDLGSEGYITMELVAMDKDELADGSGKAHMTWVACELLKEPFRMKDTDTNEGGWKKSAMRDYLTETILPLMPMEVQNNIRKVHKYSYSFENQKDERSTDLIWIPSARELYFEDNRHCVDVYIEEEGVAYTEIFKDDASRVKCRYGKSDASWWWLRSSSYNSPCSFVSVDNDGKYSGNKSNYPIPYKHATEEGGVLIGFCF